MEAIQVRLNAEIREYTHYFAARFGVNKSEWVRNVLGQKIHELKSSLLPEEIKMVEQRVNDTNNNFKKKEVRRVVVVKEEGNQKMSRNSLNIYRRRLPHWRMQGSTYFVTWRIANAQLELSPVERGIVVSALKAFSGSRYDLSAYVVMNDHIHVLVVPMGGHLLEDVIHSWKSYTAHILQTNFGRKGSIWQEEYFDRIVRDSDEFLEKAHYILNNPRKRWPDMDEYPWVGYAEEER